MGYIGSGLTPATKWYGNGTTTSVYGWFYLSFRSAQCARNTPKGIRKGCRIGGNRGPVVGESRQRGGFSMYICLLACCPSLSLDLYSPVHHWFRTYQQ